MGKNKTTKTEDKKAAVVVPENSDLITRKRKYFNPKTGKTQSKSVVLK